MAAGVSVHRLCGDSSRAIQRDARQHAEAAFSGTAEPRGRAGRWRRTTGSARRRSTTQTAIADLPWPDMMKVLMGGLAILMITNVPYPAFPKVGVRSWSGVGRPRRRRRRRYAVYLSMAESSSFPRGWRTSSTGSSRRSSSAWWTGSRPGRRSMMTAARTMRTARRDRGRDVVVGRRRRHGGRRLRLAPDAGRRPSAG